MVREKKSGVPIARRNVRGSERDWILPINTDAVMRFCHRHTVLNCRRSVLRNDESIARQVGYRSLQLGRYSNKTRHPINPIGGLLGFWWLGTCAHSVDSGGTGVGNALVGQSYDGCGGRTNK